MMMTAQSPLKILAAAACALALAGCASFPTTAGKVSKAEPAAPQLSIQSWQTDQGAKVLFVPSEALPMLDVRLVMHAGGARDGEERGLV